MHQKYRVLGRAGVAAVVASVALLASSAHYVVAPGDTLSGIAQRKGSTVGELATLNSIADPGKIRVGMRLALPGTPRRGPVTHEHASHDSHVVAAGETVDTIARDHGVSVGQIEAANGILKGRIYAGTTLRLTGVGFVARSGGIVTHTVAKDDTLAHVVSHHGGDLHEIAHLNGLSQQASLAAGTQVRLPSRWRCPVAAARFFNDWGFPRSGGRTHTGTDLFAPRGTPVVAPVSGTLTQVTGSQGGRQFTLAGDDGNTYLGSHMDSFGGAGRVDAGSVIGTVGDSGNAVGTDPHLHFQVHPGGAEAVNPYPSLVANGC